MDEYCKHIAYGQDLMGESRSHFCYRDTEYKKLYDKFFDAQAILIHNHKLLCKHLITFFILLDDFFHSVLKCNVTSNETKNLSKDDKLFTDKFEMSPNFVFLRLMSYYIILFGTIGWFAFWTKTCTLPDNKSNPICKLNTSEIRIHLLVLIGFTLITIIRLKNNWFIDAF